MPYALLIMGLVLVRAGYKGGDNLDQLQKLIVGDFTGEANFLYWLAAIGVIGGLGYIEPMRVPSRAMLVLIVIVMIIANQGFFAKFQETIANFKPAPEPATAPASGGTSTAPAPGSPAPGAATGASTAADAAAAIARGDNAGAAGSVFRYFMQGPSDLLHSFGF
jgi:hypothetical protein